CSLLTAHCSPFGVSLAIVGAWVYEKSRIQRSRFENRRDAYSTLNVVFGHAGLKDTDPKVS
ncbi:MAG TPA: hypothetical protein VE860_21625, partial [Chthoniobacterales bacterium]|nr:hypothetical protein [Chthoniobacterales bacterium]